MYKRQGEGWRDKVEITAHRGDNTQAPENTMPAFKAAVENGADWIELDVTQTKDGVLVIFHDSDLMRMTGKPDKIWDMSYEELSQINTASHWGCLLYTSRVRGKPVLRRLYPGYYAGGFHNGNVLYHFQEKALSQRKEAAF